jgi:hypothetical protein
LRACDGSDHQKWFYSFRTQQLISRGATDGSWCVDVPRGDTRPGAELISYRCHSDFDVGFNQRWWFR